ncbi:SDR family NAD(P)-dependent oxidoreductase [Brevibacillus reuszeri]|uniref:SDR family NAD(P)-dependent oxidoreductase n=1 Tax=Brevibacillus reuszeri TaxID=54915 RepID=UPI003D1DD39D
MNRVRDKVAIVTGGASGIGLASAKLLASEGAKVIVADFNLEAAQKVAREIRQAGGVAEAAFLNAADGDLIKEMMDTAVEKFGSLHILVNNVGGNNPQKDLDVVNIDIEEWDRQMNVNTKSVMLGCKYAIPHMIAAGGGSIINTASMAAFAGDAVRTAYGATKAAVVNLTRYVATQYGHQRIRCNAVAPGLILTPAAKAHISPEVMDIFYKYNALPYHGEPEDIGYTVLFLASDEAKFITGQTIQVEGGHYIGNPTVPDFLSLANTHAN